MTCNVTIITKTIAIKARDITVAALNMPITIGKLDTGTERISIGMAAAGNKELARHRAPAITKTTPSTIHWALAATQTLRQRTIIWTDWHIIMSLEMVEGRIAVLTTKGRNTKTGRIR